MPLTVETKEQNFHLTSILLSQNLHQRVVKYAQIKSWATRVQDHRNQEVMK